MKSVALPISRSIRTKGKRAERIREFFSCGREAPACRSHYFSIISFILDLLVACLQLGFILSNLSHTVTLASHGRRHSKALEFWLVQESGGGRDRIRQISSFSHNYSKFGGWGTPHVLCGEQLEGIRIDSVRLQTSARMIEACC